MRRDGRRTRVRLGLGLAMAALVSAVAAPTAGAVPDLARRRRRLPRRDAEPALVPAHGGRGVEPERRPRAARRAPGRRGAVERAGDARRGAASARSASRRSARCPPGWHDTISLQARCDRFLLIEIAVLLIGHVLGLDHDTRHCSVMSPMTGGGCKDVLYPSEIPLPPIERSRRAPGGRPVRRPPRRGPPARAVGAQKPTTTSVSAVQAETNPAGTLASTRITWRNPASRALRRVVVVRNQFNVRDLSGDGLGPSSPAASRPGGRARRRHRRTRTPPARRARRSTRHPSPRAAGVTPSSRWARRGATRRARTIKVVHPGRDLLRRAHRPRPYGRAGRRRARPALLDDTRRTRPTRAWASRRASGPCPARPGPLHRHARG